jgi:two-component system OmpR family sensor kinase
MNLPIKARLTVWYVTLFAIVVGLWSAYVIVRVRLDLYEGVDRSLATRATQLADALSQGTTSAFGDASDATLAGVSPGEAVAQLLSAGGAIVDHSGDAAAARPIGDSALRAAARTTGRAQIQTVRASGEQFRVLLVRLPGSSRYLLVGQSTESSDSAVQRLVIAMLLSGPLALIAAAFVGWLFAGRALKPVSRMAATAAGIGIDELDERVPVPRPNDELHALAETMNGMLDRLETGVQDKRRLTANASHELQTPLAVMRTELDVYLAATDLPADTREVLESVREESDRMSRIVRNLLTLARFDDGKLALLREPHDLHQLAREAVRSLETLACERRVRVESEGETVVAPVDKEYLRLAIANLLENAIRYSGEGSEIRVTTGIDRGQALLSVSDTGQGIPSSAVPYIFDRFYRVEATRSKESGSGLGLAITKEIVESHGGTIELATKKSDTTFAVHLPLRVEEDAPASNGQGVRN